MEIVFFFFRYLWTHWKFIPSEFFLGQIISITWGWNFFFFLRIIFHSPCLRIFHVLFSWRCIFSCFAINASVSSLLRVRFSMVVLFWDPHNSERVRTFESKDSISCSTCPLESKLSRTHYQSELVVDAFANFSKERDSCPLEKSRERFSRVLLSRGRGNFRYTFSELLTTCPERKNE